MRSIWQDTIAGRKAAASIRRPAHAFHPETPSRRSAEVVARRRFLHLAAGAAALPARSRFAWAQAYPSRPITMIVPTTPGSPSDAVARVVAERMRGALGQPIIIENVGGAGGN